MDYIKNWIDYFRGNTTNRTIENNANDLKDELWKINENISTVPDRHQERDIMDIMDFPERTLKFFFGDMDEHSNQSDFSDMEDLWPFGGGIFHRSNAMHREFMNFTNQLHNEFFNMHEKMFQDFPGEFREEGREYSNMGENLRDSYLRVPQLVTPAADNSNELNVIIPGNEGNKVTSNMNTISNSRSPYFRQTSESVSVSVGPDGIVEITKVIKDSNGETQKTVTKINLKDKNL